MRCADMQSSHFLQAAEHYRRKYSLYKRLLGNVNCIVSITLKEFSTTSILSKTDLAGSLLRRIARNVDLQMTLQYRLL